MKNNRSRHFNMLEVILAITVIGAGLTLLLVLFPVATRTAAETVDNNYVTMVADTFITMIKGDIDANGTWVTLLPDYTRDEKTVRADDIGMVPDVLDMEKNPLKYNLTQIASSGSAKLTDTKIASDTNKGERVLLYNYANTNNGFCAVVNNYIPTDVVNRYDKVVDFSAFVRIEKMPVAILQTEVGYFNREKNTSQLNAIPEQAPCAEADFVRVMVTMSWPLEVAPSARKSRIFIVEKARLQ